MTTPAVHRPTFDPPPSRSEPADLPPPPPDAPGFRRRTFTTGEAASLLGVSDETIRLACQRGTLLVNGEAVPFPSLQLGARRVIPRRAVYVLLGEVDTRLEALSPAEVLAAARLWDPATVLQLGRQLIGLGADALGTAYGSKAPQ